MTHKANICAVLVAGALTAGTTGTALALCRGNELAGPWTQHWKVIDDGDGSVAICAVNLTFKTRHPIRYSIAGNCRSFKPDGHSTFAIRGNQITVTRDCRLLGRFVLDSELDSTAVILDAQVETPAKRNAIGVARTRAGGKFQVIYFKMTR
jgi:hypothetical protein